MHGLRETQRTGLARKIIGTSPSISPPSPLHTLHTRTASQKMEVAVHHLHLDTLPILPSHSSILIGLSIARGSFRPRQPGWYGTHIMNVTINTIVSYPMLQVWRSCRRKWRLTDTDLCPCGETQTMSHIVESCPLTKLNGGLSRLHSADEDAVSWLTNYG